MKNTEPYYFSFFGVFIMLLADEIQDLTNKQILELENRLAEKEKEIMTI